MTRLRPRAVVITALGAGQILAWGCSYLLIAVLAKPIAEDTGWPMGWIVGSLSIGLLVSGLISPAVGRLIDRHGGRPLMMGSAVALTLGLLVAGLAPNLPMFVGGWLVLGLAMGMGLYDPAFSTLGRLYGQNARSAISLLTIMGGFSATVCWPFSAFLVEQAGWRGTCLVYAALNLFLLLPLYWLALPREARREPLAANGIPARKAGRVPDELRATFLLLAAGFTLTAAISTIISVHLLNILQAQGWSLAAAVGASALMGPTQVSIRFVEMAFGRNRHPIWSLLAGTLLVSAGLAMLLGSAGLIVAGVMCYAAGNGFRSISRATVPLALFDRQHYGTLMGKLSMPMLIMQAASPSIGALLMDHAGATGTTIALFCMGAASIALALPLLPLARRAREG